MPSLDPNIILGIRPAQAVDPLEQAGKVLGIKGALQQQELHGVQLQEAQREFESGTKIRALLQANPNATPEQVMAIDPVKGIAFRKSAMDNAKSQAELQKTQQEVLGKAIAQHRDDLANVSTPDDFAHWLSAGYSDPILGPILSKQQPLADALSKIPTDPVAFEQMKQKQALGATAYIKANAPHYSTQDTGGMSNIVATPGLGGTPRVVSSTPKTLGPEGAANRANRLLVAGLDANGKPIAATQPGEQIDIAKVSAADLEAGYRYFSDGTLPPNMGRGTQGTAQSTRIRSIAAQISQNLGISPEEARANQLAFKGSASALTPLLRREAQIGANVKNFDFNAGQVAQLSQKVDRTGVPVVNAWLNAGRRSVAGNPDVSAFDVAVKTTVNEFAQIVSGTTAGATTEGEKQKAEKLLSAAQTPAQITSVLNQMKIESQNRMKSFADQKREVLGNMRAGGASKPEASAAPPTAQSAAPTRADIEAELRRRGVLK